jgi:hypothetical protein
MGLELTNKTIDKYFGFLSRLDNSSKKRLIVKLTESIKEETKSETDFRSLYGAWEDSRSSDEIIKEIRNSRIDKQDKKSRYND